MLKQPQQQQRVISAPQPDDKSLLEFSSNVQQNTSELWQFAHTHNVTAADKANYDALTTDADRIAFIAAFLGLV